MFGWLRNKFGGASGAQAGGAKKMPPSPAAPREKARDDAFWDKLRESRGAFTPLTPEAEQQVVERVCQVVDYVCANPIEPPAMPALAPRILEVVRQPDVDIPVLVRVLEQDQAISAKLLSVANSAAFGPAKEIATLRDAIVYMGVEQTAQIAVVFATKSLFDADGRAELAMYRGRWARLFSHGMTTAFAAGAFAAQKFRRSSDEAFLGGLFHDVGKVVALRAVSALTLAGEWDLVDELVMDEVLYRIHATPGAEFYDRWTLPKPLMQVCCDHHQHENAADAPQNFHVISIMSSLDALRAGSAADKRYAIDELRTSAERLGMSDAELRVAHHDVQMFAERVARLFGG